MLPDIVKNAETFFLYDTETTGFARKIDAPFKDQPYCIQFSGILADRQGRTLWSATNLMRWNEIKPDYWDNEKVKGALELNGITPELIESFGTEPDSVMAEAAHFLSMADIAVAHNERFDRTMGHVSLNRTQFVGDDFKDKYHFCTMVHSRKHLPQKKNDLQSLHTHLFGEGFDGAHDAGEDTRALKRVFFEILKQEEGCNLLDQERVKKASPPPPKAEKPKTAPKPKPKQKEMKEVLDPSGVF